jgi:hypothetical protein
MYVWLSRNHCCSGKATVHCVCCWATCHCQLCKIQTLQQRQTNSQPSDYKPANLGSGQEKGKPLCRFCLQFLNVGWYCLITFLCQKFFTVTKFEANRQWCGTKRSWHTIGYYPSTWGDWGKILQARRGCRFSGQYLNPGPRRHEAGVSSWVTVCCAVRKHPWRLCLESYGE